MLRRAALAVLVSLARPALAQQADVIRGRVTDADGKPIEHATIQATSIPNNVPRTARTDRNGRYTLTYPTPDGDYWLTISALGFASRRFELKRIADEAVLIGDATLTAVAPVLDAVKVRAERTRPDRDASQQDPLGTEKSVGTAAVDPTQAGSLAALAASLPGVQLVPGADGNPDQFSVYGLGGDQNASTLNGLGFGGGEVPRDAATRMTLNTTPWDVSRGGFSGAQLALRTQSGSNFSARAASLLVNAPGAQWTDRAGRATGAEFTSLSLGAATTGPIAMDRSFYSAGYQLDRRTSDRQSLTDADPLALRLAGVAPDSAARFRQLLARAGVPPTVPGLPGARTTERASFLGAFDLAPPSSTSGQALNVTATGTFTRARSVLGRVTALPTDDVGGTNWFGAVQARHTGYLGSGILSESSLGASRMRNDTDPYARLPNGVVRVASVLDDGTAAIGRLTFGGSPTQRQATTATGVAAQSQLSWVSLDNRHRLKLTGELRWDAFEQRFTSNQFGTYAYNSLADLEAARPASFTRLLAPRVTTGGQLAGGASLGDAWRVTPDLQLQYGVRIDANRFLNAPASNPVLSNALGVDNARLPDGVYASPRVGFAWSYGAAPQLAIAGGFVRAPRAVVRGGVGVFQGMPSVQLAGPAIGNTGRADAVQALACVGAAVPRPDWSAFAASTGAIPARCADGSTASPFASSAPIVSLVDAGWRAPRSLRSNVSWSGTLAGSRLAATVDATWSRTVNQSGVVDLNFDPTARFTLADEGNRPVYAQPGSIVAATGAIAAQEARRSPDFRNVLAQRADLSSTNRQLAVGVAPVAFSSRASWSLAYVYSSTRDATSGFASTAGDPRAVDRARAALDARHQLVYTLSYNILDWVPVSWQGSFRSGRPFTPMVATDVNGDGFANDRAFVFDPVAATNDATNDPALAGGMRALLDGGSAAARACLARQLGRVAARASCQAPWSSTSSLTIGLNPVKFRLPQRANVSLHVSNALGAADLLLHGERGRRGWGQAYAPDQALLYVRGFDATARRFRYDVNPRFGATSLTQTLGRTPVVVTAQLRVDVGYTRERQLLTQSLDRGRGRPGARATDQDVRGMGGALIPANPMALLLAQADTLGLTRRQADSLATLNRAYALAFEAIWTPVARWLVALPPEYDRAAAYDRYRRAREASVDALLTLVPAVRGMLTADQLRRLPPRVASSLDPRYLASVRSSTAGGASLGALGMLAQMGWTGGTVDASGGNPSVMIHR